MLGGAPVHLSTIGHFDDKYNEFFVLDLIENPERALPDSITSVLPRELLATTRSWIRRKLLDSLNHALAHFLLIDRFNLFGRGALDDEPIACHCAAFS